MKYSQEDFVKAVEQGNKEYVELLIKAGIDVNAKDNNGYTPARARLPLTRAKLLVV